MRYGILSDIHSNLEAFQAVLADLEGKRIDQYIFLGDIIGYGADPVACLRILRGMVSRGTCLCVAGNHDLALFKPDCLKDFVYYAKDALLWTQGLLGQEERDFLMKIPLLQRTDDLIAVHASVNHPEEWKYISDIDDAYVSFQQMDRKVCFIGHTHKPVVFSADNTVSWFYEDTFQLADGCRYIVNDGSVGQPRDGDPRAAYVIYDTAVQIIEFHRVVYDIEQSQAKIIAAGLPKIIAERLAYGK